MEVVEAVAARSRSLTVKQHIHAAFTLSNAGRHNRHRVSTICHRCDDDLLLGLVDGVVEVVRCFDRPESCISLVWRGFSSPGEAVRHCEGSSASRRICCVWLQDVRAVPLEVRATTPPTGYWLLGTGLTIRCWCWCWCWCWCAVVTISTALAIGRASLPASLALRVLLLVALWCWWSCSCTLQNPRHLCLERSQL